MPTYEYECLNCGYKFESFEKISDIPFYKDCPRCGKNKAKRLISNGAGLIFKGTGFYVTDYKKKTTGSSQEKTESSSKGEEKKSKTNLSSEEKK